MVKAGDCVHPRPGVQPYLFHCLPAMAYLEIVGLADFSSVDGPAACDVPAPKAWRRQATEEPPPPSGRLG